MFFILTTWDKGYFTWISHGHQRPLSASQAVTTQGPLLSSLRKELRFPMSYISYRELFALNRFLRYMYL